MEYILMILAFALGYLLKREFKKEVKQEVVVKNDYEDEKEKMIEEQWQSLFAYTEDKAMRGNNNA